MNSLVRLFLAGLLVSLCGSSLATPPRTEFEQSFIGREWIPECPDAAPYPLSYRCKYLGGYEIRRKQKEVDGFSIQYFTCNGRELDLFAQTVDGRKLKVIDALLLPRLKPGERLMQPGECELNGNNDTYFTALVHLGRREKVDWKTGVRAAWIPTPETGKIEELSTRHVVCWRPTPP